MSKPPRNVTRTRGIFVDELGGSYELMRTIGRGILYFYQAKFIVLLKYNKMINFRWLWKS